MQSTPCYLCGLQFPLPLTLLWDVPSYSSFTDSISIINRRVCKPCGSVLANIQLFVTQTQLKYNSPNYKNTVLLRSAPTKTPNPKKALQVIYETTAKTPKLTRSSSDSKQLQARRATVKQITLTEQNLEQQHIHPYVMLIVEEMRQKNYLLLSHLPKTLLYLIHLSTVGLQVTAEERHEKIKNVILLLAESINLALEELPYVLLLANFLFCLMDANKVVSVLTQLSNVVVSFPGVVSWRGLLLEQEKVNEVPQSPATLDLKHLLLRVDKLMVRIEVVVDLGRRGEGCLREGLLRLGKVESGSEWKEYRRRVEESVKGLGGKEEANEEQLAALYHLKLQRNSFNLILRQILKDEQQIKEELMHQTHIFIREKQEYIDKIVEMTQKIEGLEQRIREMQEESRRRGSKEEEEGIDILPETHEGKDMDPEKNELAVSEETNFLQSIVAEVNLFGFNSSRGIGGTVFEQTLQNKAKQLSQAIVAQILRLQQGYDSLSRRIKSSQSQKTSLLDILTRKQDRMLTVLTQKDIVIDRYEQALWRMQNGLQVTEQPMAHRIRYIMHIFSTRGSPEKERSPKEKKEERKKDDCEIY